MMRVWHIARREWLEQARQPVMLGVILTLYLLLTVVVLTPLGVLQLISSNQAYMNSLTVTLGPSITPNAFISATTSGILVAFNFLLFTQFLGIAAVMAGHAVLHDRQSGTLTFLLLSPVRRLELFAGKVLGSMGPTFVLYLVVSGSTAMALLLFPITAPFPDYLPTNPAWWVAFLLGGPAWGVFIATVCTIVSSFATDVRTSQQSVWFVMFFGQFMCGMLLTYGLPSGTLAQLAVALVGMIAAAGAQFIGSLTFRRDLGR
jgi:ABC-type transport system involved in multi-copper enzyme maturation permease subunit